MLRDGRLGQRQFIDDVAAHPRFLLGEHPENAHSNGMADCFGKCGELVVCGGSLDRGLQKFGCLTLLRRAAKRIVSTQSRFGSGNGLGSHRLSSIDDSTVVRRLSKEVVSGSPWQPGAGGGAQSVKRGRQLQSDRESGPGPPALQLSALAW